MNIPDLVRLSTEKLFSCPLDFLLNVILTGSGIFGSKKCLHGQKKKFRLNLGLINVSVCDKIYKSLLSFSLYFFFS